VAGKGWGELQIRRVGGGDFTDFPAPASGSTDNGKVWAWNSITQAFEPRTYLLASAVSAFGLTLIDDADAATARGTLGLGTAAVLNVGTSANNVVQLDGSAKLPAVDGSQLTGISGGGVAGSTTQVIFNDAGAYGGDAGLTYAKATDRLTVAGGLIAPSMRPASDSTTALQWQNAAGTAVVTVDTTNSRLGIRKTPNAANLDVSTAASTLIGIQVKDSANQSEPLFRAMRVDDLPMVDIGRGVDGYGLLTIYSANTSNYVKLSGNNALVISTGQTATFRLLPSGNDIFFQNTVTAGNIYFTGNNSAALSGNVIFKLSGGTAFGDITPSAFVDITASTTARASLRIREASQVPSAPNSGDVWFPTGGRLTFRRSTTTEIVATGVTGSGASATAGGTYGATEQAMLNAIYAAGRAFGLIA